MRELVIECLSSGRTFTDTFSLIFNKENMSIVLEVEFPELYEDYDKSVEIISGDITTFKDLPATLTSSVLKSNEIKIQPIATKNDIVQKWQVVTVKIQDALNVLDDNDAIEESVARELLNKIDNVGQETRDELDIKEEVTVRQVAEFVRRL